MRTAERRGALLLTTLLVAAGVGWTSSPSVAAAGCPDGMESCVVVKVVSTKNFVRTTERYVVVSGEDIDAWSADDTRDDGKTFYVRDKAGEDRRPVSPAIKNPLSLQELLKKEPDLQGVKITFSEVAGDDGTPSVLDRPAFSEQGAKDYPFGNEPPVVVYSLSGGRIGYFRTATNDSNDVNRGDRIVRTGRLDLVIHTTGRLLEPTVTVSDTTPSTKDEPTFSASIGKSRPTLKYRWDFGDARGPNRGSKSPTHRYTKRGTYNAFVRVRGDDGSYGRSDAVTVKVGKPPKAPQTPSSGSGGGSTGGTGNTGSTGGYTPPYVAPVPGLPGAIDLPPVDDLPSDDPVEDEPVDDLPVDDGLVEVEGYVLAGSEIVPGGTPESIPGTETSAQPAPTQASVRSRIATWTVAALAIALLVGAGAASETRWLRNRLRPFRRRA